MRRITMTVLALLMAAGARADVAADLAAAADKLKAALPEAQQAQLILPFEQKERVRWSFFPGEHDGLRLGDCDEAAQAAMLGVARTALSASGFEKTELVRQLDDVLGAAAPDRYSAGNYYLAIWGTPGAEGAWALRWEGHHLSLNWLVKDGKVMASTPQFIGSNPANVLEGPRIGLRVQSAEEDQARALLQALSDDQRAIAIAGAEAPGDITTSMNPRVRGIDPAGIEYSALNAEQQTQLRALIQLYIDVQAEPLQAARAAALSEDALAATRFAWFGGTESGQPHYYRIQGPGYVIEYANTQNNANHIHTVWRDFENDFGRDVLEEHLAMFHGVSFLGAAL